MAATVATVTPKRVSFGSGASLVETWIIDDLGAMPSEERLFYQDTVLKKSLTNSTMSSSGSSHSGSMNQASTPTTETPSSKLGTESHENPFLAEGVLSKKAEYIISHSTISRTELKIEDPDQMKALPVEEEEVCVKADGSAVQSAPPDRPNEINVKDQNGKLEEPIAPSSVEVVEKANATQPEPEKAEEVKVKNNNKCKCCTIM